MCIPWRRRQAIWSTDMYNSHAKASSSARHVFGKQPPHNFGPDRLRQLALEKAFEYRHFAGIVAMFLRHGQKIGFLSLKRVFRAKLRQEGENLVEQSPGVGDGREDKVDFVYVQYLVLEDRLGGGKKQP